MLSPQHIIDDILSLACNKRVWVAYSGGADSHVLLHILATSKRLQLQNMTAVHVNHGLHVDSTKWAQHCASVSARLGIAFCSLDVRVQGVKTLGLEAAARRARYHALQAKLSERDVLLSAQHQQDQAETVLLQLLRGAGTKGLSAMSKQSRLGKAELLRPFLSVTKSDILIYARQHRLHWIDDPSNDDIQRDRNYIRHIMWPLIEKRWQGAATTIGRSAQHCADTNHLLIELAISDLARLDIDLSANTLPISVLLTLPFSRLCNVLRYWISCKKLPLPTTTLLQKIIDEVCLAKPDSNPLLCWQGAEARRYRNDLYIMQPLAKHDKKHVYRCYDFSDISISDQSILSWQRKRGEGIKEALIASGITIGFRQGGERFKPHGWPYRTSLKSLFQKWAVPPWQRDRIPLIYHHHSLIAVAGYRVAHGYVASNDEYGLLATVSGL